MSSRERTRRELLKHGTLAMVGLGGLACSNEGRKVVVLTFDDAVKSHRTFVAPLLKELGFQATFFVTHRWMSDAENFMSWQDIAEIHDMGFEIGNHSWTHADFSQPRNAARLAGELALVEYELDRAGVPKPDSFAYCGNAFGPEALAVIRKAGYRFARRGMQPEVPYGTLGIGSALDLTRHDPLLIPTTADAYPDWTLDHFKKVVAQPGDGIVVLQFHGVPDRAHPWVDTNPDLFRRCMEHLDEEGCRVVAVRDLASWARRSEDVDDPHSGSRYPAAETEELTQPVEVAATQLDLKYWLANMLQDHDYSVAEAAVVTGREPEEIERQAEPTMEPGTELLSEIKVRPYPGGRHPRIGFLDGAVDPLRGTKASVFLPWHTKQYVVVDLPEAIFSGDRLLFLAHTHIPTIWNDQNLVIDNVDWQRLPGGGLQSRWDLPNEIAFGAEMRPLGGRVAMKLWLTNGTREPLSGLRTQVCVMLKGATDFNDQVLDNKLFEQPVSAAKSRSGDRWILTAWQRAGRCWGNQHCPCLHSDPVLPDCAPGETVRVNGQLWFYEGPDPSEEIRRGARLVENLSTTNDVVRV